MLLKVLYSFPHKIGSGRICYIAWQQVNGIADAGASVVLFPGAVHRPVDLGIPTLPTLARGRLRIPYKLLGAKRACALHDLIVARRLARLSDKPDVLHAWPLGARRTLKVAAKLGIITVLERPNAHTRFAYRAVREECECIGVPMPRGHEHAFKPDFLAIEEEEYRLADFLLCPSDFVLKTFVDQGYPANKLLRHHYGFDEKTCHPDPGRADRNRGLTMIFVGGCAPRKGLHYALNSWLQSPASRDGKFLIAGEFIPGYREKLSQMLSHPSVQVLGYRTDVPDLMRASDLFVLPSIEEGSALVTSEARGNGCVLLVSDASGATCTHLENALVHSARDVATLTSHITMLHQDRAMLERLRAKSLATADEITWSAAGKTLVAAYLEALKRKQERFVPQAASPSV